MKNSKKYKKKSGQHQEKLLLSPSILVAPAKISSCHKNLNLAATDTTEGPT
jgi:hypothetical protein